MSLVFRAVLWEEFKDGSHSATPIVLMPFLGYFNIKRGSLEK